MNKRKEQTKFIFENAIPWLILAVLLIYTYAKFFQHSYLGFRVDSTGQVIFVFDGGLTEPTLRVGDQLIQVDSMRWDDFRSDLRKVIFPNVQPGQVVSLLIERDGRELTIPWKAAGPNRSEIVDLVVSEGWLAFFFWLVGTLTFLNLRPKDERWYLIIAFNYLTALILAFGSGVSFYHTWGSAILLRSVVWLCLPVYLHLHWAFPYPFRKLPGPLLWAAYSGAVLLAVAEWFQLLPRGLFNIGFLLAFGGSVILLLLHAILQPETRRDLRLLIVISLMAVLPSIATGIVGSFVADPSGRFLAWIGGGALLSMPLLPLAYLYAAYRRQLGKLELRINRLLTEYLFFTLLAVVFVLPISLLAIRYNSPGATIIISIVSIIIAGLMILSVYPRFESFVERRLFRIRLPTENIQELYSTHIIASSSLSDLLKLLEDDLLPSLLVQQFVFLQVDRESTKVIFVKGVTHEQVPQQPDVSMLLGRAGTYLIPDPSITSSPFSWIRLILPLRLDGVLIGLWLFGSRDPDDAYPQVEIPILQSLANQTAVALSNILQTEHLKAMYEANIGRYEQERLRLAHDLHDSILNEMAALLMRGDAPVFSPAFQQAFEELTERLREIVNDLRPPMLAFGLKLALEDFVENLIERSHNSVEFVADVQTDGDWRYPDVVENNLYRIVQEACENALRYAHAKKIIILGRLRQKEIDIGVVDDGVGFGSEISLKLDEMLANKHFGLAGMYERANLMDAEISINSKSNQGTQIQVLWKPKETI
jgi:signal transduction histidine kinase